VASTSIEWIRPDSLAALAGELRARVRPRASARTMRLPIVSPSIHSMTKPWPKLVGRVRRTVDLRLRDAVAPGEP